MGAALRNNQFMVIEASWAIYHRTLLTTARTLLADGHHGPALALALTAGEIFTERVCAAWCRARGIPELAKAVTGMVPSYNLRDDRVRALYTALTGDPIAEQQQSFWPAFVESVKLRNGFVHRGAAVTREQAEAGCTAVAALLDHLERIQEQAVQRR